MSAFPRMPSWKRGKSVIRSPREAVCTYYPVQPHRSDCGSLSCVPSCPVSSPPGPGSHTQPPPRVRFRLWTLTHTPPAGCAVSGGSRWGTEGSLGLSPCSSVERLHVCTWAHMLVYCTQTSGATTRIEPRFADVQDNQREAPRLRAATGRSGKVSAAVWTLGGFYLRALRSHLFHCGAHHVNPWWTVPRKVWESLTAARKERAVRGPTESFRVSFWPHDGRPC